MPINLNCSSDGISKMPFSPNLAINGNQNNIFKSITYWCFYRIINQKINRTLKKKQVLYLSKDRQQWLNKSVAEWRDEKWETINRLNKILTMYWTVELDFRFWCHWGVMAGQRMAGWTQWRERTGQWVWTWTLWRYEADLLSTYRNSTFPVSMCGATIIILIIIKQSMKKAKPFTRNEATAAQSKKARRKKKQEIPKCQNEEVWRASY